MGRLDVVVENLRGAVEVAGERVACLRSGWVTRLLTDAIEYSLELDGLLVRREWTIHMPSGPDLFIDLAARREWLAPADLVIEIDRGNNSKSVRKLVEAQRRGIRAVWVRWGSFMPATTPVVLVPRGIEVIEVPLQQRSIIVRSPGRGDLHARRQRRWWRLSADLAEVDRCEGTQVRPVGRPWLSKGPRCG